MHLRAVLFKRTSPRPCWKPDDGCHCFTQITSAYIHPPTHPAVLIFLSVSRAQKQIQTQACLKHLRWFLNGLLTPWPERARNPFPSLDWFRAEHISDCSFPVRHSAVVSRTVSLFVYHRQVTGHAAWIMKPSSSKSLKFNLRPKFPVKDAASASYVPFFCILRSFCYAHSQT